MGLHGPGALSAKKLSRGLAVDSSLIIYLQTKQQQ